MKKVLFYTLLLVLPLNLGLHLIQPWSYVGGLLVDYLIPTLYVQDFLILGILILWLFELVRNPTQNLSSLRDLGWNARLLFLFVFCALLSVLGSKYSYSILLYLRLLLYVFFSLYVAYTIDFSQRKRLIVNFLCISIAGLSVLGIGQFTHQGSVFDSYLFLGEQPYNFSTFGIAKESFLGRTFVPPYGLFRHPNIFAGFLSIVLLWVFAYFREHKSKLYLAILSVGSITLLLTYSLTAWLALGLGILLLINRSKWPRLLVLILLFSSLLLPFFVQTFQPASQSFGRREQLLTAAYTQAKDNLLFGYGYGTSTEVLANNVSFFGDFKFPQPVHNIFIIILLESGAFALLFFCLFLFKVLFSPTYSLGHIALIQFILLGSFDHYPYTIHQTSILFWLTVGFYLSYTLNTNYDQ